MFSSGYKIVSGVFQAAKRESAEKPRFGERLNQERAAIRRQRRLFDFRREKGAVHTLDDLHGLYHRGEQAVGQEVEIAVQIRP